MSFVLKPNSYGYVDNVLPSLKSSSKNLYVGEPFLSRGGRLVLIKSVLCSILVYWATIAKIPKGILTQIRKACFKFLWSGKNKEEGIPLVKWSKLARPKDLGGWRIHNLFWFNKALAAKILWRLISNKMLWGRVLTSKYMAGKSIEYWFKSPRKSTFVSSTGWKAMVDAFPLIEAWSEWCIGSKRNVRIGEDPWEWSTSNFKLSEGLIRRLHA